MCLLFLYDDDYGDSDDNDDSDDDDDSCSHGGLDG